MVSMSNSLRFLVLVSLLSIFSLIGACSNSDKGDTVDENEFDQALDEISTSTMVLMIEDYATQAKYSLANYEPEFQQIMKHIEDATVTREQSRIATQDGKAVEVKIPYTINSVLKFILSDGNLIRFDYGLDNIWFNTDTMIYGASVSTELDDILSQLANNVSTSGWNPGMMSDEDKAKYGIEEIPIDQLERRAQEFGLSPWQIRELMESGETVFYFGHKLDVEVVDHED